MKQKGFTLVELLVVISIIGILATTVILSLNRARAKARDTKRKADLIQLSKALELFYDNNNGYPDDTVAAWDISCKGSDDLSDIVTEGLISRIPCDPINNAVESDITGSAYGYWFEPDGSCGTTCSNYCLYTNLEAGGQFGIKGGDYSQCPP